MKNHVLIITTDPPPLPGIVPSGAGMRAWGLALGLRSNGMNDVTVAFAADAVRGEEAALPPIPGVKTFERSRLTEFLQKEAPSAVVFQHWSLLTELREDIDVPIAIDLAGPHLLERHFWGSKDPIRDRAEKIRALRRADYTVCSGEFQRRYFLPYLLEAGHSAEGALCPVIPFSLSPEMPESAADLSEPLFVYAGTFLPWQDPSVALTALLRAIDSKGRGRLLFIGGPHAGGDVSGGRFDALIEQLRNHPRVEMPGTLPFDQLVMRLRQSAVAIDVMTRNAERELAFPTRTVTYLWAGVPVVHHDYDELAQVLDSKKAGWVFDPTDADGMEKLFARLIARPQEIARRAENAQALVRERYTWDKTITPLLSWAQNPKRRSAAKLLPIPELSPAALAGAMVVRKKRPKRTAKPVKPVQKWYLSPLLFVALIPISIALATIFFVTELIRLFVIGSNEPSDRYTSARNKRGTRRS